MGAKGPSSIDTVSPEIVPVINVADLSGQDLSARQEVYKMGFTVQAGVAAEYPHCQLFNPATSGIALVVDSAWVRVANNAFWQVRIYDTAITTQGGNLSTVDVPGDDAFTWGGGAADSVGQIRTQSNAAVLGSIIINNAWSQSTDSDLVPLGIRLLPGRGIVFVCTTVNTSLTVSWAWREIRDVP